MIENMLELKNCLDARLQICIFNYLFNLRELARVSEDIQIQWIPLINDYLWTFRVITKEKRKRERNNKLFFMH